MTSTAVKEEQTANAEGAPSERVLAKKIERVSSEIPATQQRVAELEAEREKLVVPARVDRDTAAQKRIREIDEELLALQRDLADDQAAAHDLSGRLERVRKARLLAEWDRERGEIRKLLVNRSAGTAVGEILELATRFEEALRKLQAEDTALSEALTKLAPQWVSTWRNLAKAHRPLANFVGWTLMEVLPIDTRGMRSDSMRRYQATEWDRAIVERVLAQLDDLELVV